MLLSAAYDGMVRQWDVYSGQCIRVFEGHNSAGINCFGVWRSRNGSKQLALSRIRSMDSLQSESDVDLQITRLATGAWDGTVRLWESVQQNSPRLVNAQS